MHGGKLINVVVNLEEWERCIVSESIIPRRNKVLGSWGWIMSLAAALSAFGSLNGTFFSGGRACFVAAREGHMVRALCRS